MTTIGTTSGVSGLGSARSLFENAMSSNTNATANTNANSTTDSSAGAGTQDTTALDQPDANYPNLPASHVAVLRAAGSSDEVLTWINANYTAAQIDSYIQTDILKNPEGWDDFVGNPRGTARMGLQQAFPGIQLPSATGYTTSTTSGTPTANAPVAVSQASQAEGIIKGIVIAAAVVGVGALIWHFAKGRSAEKAVESQIKSLIGDANGLAGLSKDGLKSLLKNGKVDGEAVRALAASGALVGDGAGIGAGIAARLDLMSVADSVKRGIGVPDPWLNRVITSGVFGNVPFETAAQAALQHEQQQTLRVLASKAGSIPEFLLAQQALGHAGGAAANNDGVKAALRALADAVT